MQKDLKLKIISEGLKKGVTPTCKKYNISRTLYYRWLKKYKTKGFDGLDSGKKNFVPVNKTSNEIEHILLDMIQEYPHYGPRAINYLLDELGYKLSESAVYNIMHRHNLTRKENRLKFARKNPLAISESIPPLNDLGSGECWLFSITDYGRHEGIGHLYSYTLYDLKSHIACTRLYTEISFTHFEELLTAVAMPVAKTLDLQVNYLCFLKDDKLLSHSKRHFHTHLEKFIWDNGFDFKIHILLDTNKDLATIRSFITTYTEGCISFLIPSIHKSSSFDTLKVSLQDYVRSYNMHHPFLFEEGLYSPLDYHTYLTHKKTILPIWAYINRVY